MPFFFMRVIGDRLYRTSRQGADPYRIRIFRREQAPALPVGVIRNCVTPSPKEKVKQKLLCLHSESGSLPLFFMRAIGDRLYRTGRRGADPYRIHIFRREQAPALPVGVIRNCVTPSPKEKVKQKLLFCLHSESGSLPLFFMRVIGDRLYRTGRRGADPYRIRIFRREQAPALPVGVIRNCVTPYPKGECK